MSAQVNKWVIWVTSMYVNVEEDKIGFVQKKSKHPDVNRDTMGENREKCLYIFIVGLRVEY